MNKNLYKFAIVVMMLICKITAFAQCEIRTRIASDGSLYYYMDPVNFYWTKSKNLSGGIVTDKEYYYIFLQPHPFPPKPAGRKLKDSLEVKLSNKQIYKLGFYYSNYEDDDTTFELLYLIEKKDLADFQTYDVLQVIMNMEGEEGLRTYNFKLHQHALVEHLNCFIEDKKKKEEKKE